MMSQQSDDDVKKIQIWLEKQPHLPKNVHETLIKRFLHCCENSLEQTKHFIDYFFTVRSQAPEIFDNRDPLDPDIRRVFDNVEMTPLPVKTPNNHQLLFYRILDKNPDNFQYVNSLKALFMLADVRILLHTDIADGEIPIFDMSGWTLKHLAKVNLSVMRKYMIYSQEAHPIKLRQIHIVNVPSFIDKCMTVVKPFLKSEVGKMMHFHQTNSTTLHDFISVDLLPNEYGGKAGEFTKLKAEWIEKVIQHRDYLMDPTRWKMDPSKRLDSHNGCNGIGSTIAMEGSFRSLSID